MFKLKDPNSKLQRWKIKLEEYDYEVIYKKGKYNTNADALSRIQINALDEEEPMPGTSEDKNPNNANISESIMGNVDDIDIQNALQEIQDQELPSFDPNDLERILNENETVH